MNHDIIGMEISEKELRLNKKFDRGVSMLTWAYNEEKLIIGFLERATKLLEDTVEDYEIILVDDGSTDKTYELAKSFQETHPRLKIIKNPENVDVGISAQRAIQAATKEFLFWEMVDWCYDISDIRLFLDYLLEYDIVLGVRRSAVEIKSKFLKPIILFFRLFNREYLAKRSDSVKKSIISIVHYFLVRLLFNIPVSDVQDTTFFPTKWVQSIKFETKSSFYGPEILIKSYWNGKSIKEVPINFISRKVGVSKGTRMKAIMATVKDIFRLWFRWIILGKRGKIKKGEICRLINSQK